MSTALLPADQRARFARSAGAMLAMPALIAAVDAEVEATFTEHPALPRTEPARRILWGLALPKLSQAALAATEQPKTATA
jgi:hypothetical protein